VRSGVVVMRFLKWCCCCVSESGEKRVEKNLDAVF